MRFTLKGTVGDEEVKRAFLFDGQFDTGYVLRKFVIAPNNENVLGDTRGAAKLATMGDLSSTSGATWNWGDNREIGWASWGSEIGGGGSAAVRPPVFSLVDDAFIIVEDLYIYNQSAAIDLGYYIELEKVKISEWEGALSMVRARSQG